MIDLLLISYNKARWIGEGIENALRQGERVRVFVIDNNSTDDSLKICESYPVTVLAQKENLGMVGAIKLAIEISAARYIMVFSAEDPLIPGIIEKMAMILDDGKAEIVGSDYEIINEDGARLRDYKCSFGPELIFYDSMPGHFLAKRSVYEKVMWRDVVAEGVNAYNDWDFWLQCLRKNIKVELLPDIGFKYRQHASLTSNANLLRGRFKEQLRKNFEENALKFYFLAAFLFLKNPESVSRIVKETFLKLRRMILKKSFFEER